MANQQAEKDPLMARLDSMIDDNGNDIIDGVDNETLETNEEVEEVDPNAPKEEGDGTDDGDSESSGTVSTKKSEPKPKVGKKDKKEGKGNPPAKPLDGEVIPPGAAQRFRNEAIQYGTALQKLYPEYQKLKTENDAFKQAATVANQLQLAPNEQASALQFYASYKKNPTEAVNALLTGLREAGHDLTALGIGGPSVDTAAILNTIKQTLQPLLGDRQQAQQAAEARTAATNEVQTFVNAHEDALPHLDVIHQMLERDPNATLDSAYLQLKIYALERNLDWKLPLKPQVQASEAQVAPKKVQQQQQQKPIPRGGNAGVRAQKLDTSQADVGSSYKDIARQVMRDLNLHVGDE